MIIEELLEEFGVIALIIIAVIIIYYIVLLAKVWDVANRTKYILDDNLYFKDEIKKMNDNLERIAQALEQDEEPYIQDDLEDN